jgi:hypothetical protein
MESGEAEEDDADTKGDGIDPHQIHPLLPGEDDPKEPARNHGGQKASTVGPESGRSGSDLFLEKGDGGG